MFEYKKTLIIIPLLSAILVAGAAIGQNTAVVPIASSENRAAAAGWTKGGAWIDQHNDINKIGQTRPVDLVFLGDSITQSFGGDGRNTGQPGRAVWDMYYSHRNAAGFGISGDRTQHILWRIDHGNFDAISPKVIVLMIGTNNMAYNTAEEIAAGIKAILKKLRTKTPQSKILLLSTFPRGQMSDHEYRIKTNSLNAIICHFHDGENIYYLDLTKTFLNTDGTANPKLMGNDYIHLKSAGYRAWAVAIENTLAQLLDEAYIQKVVSIVPAPRQVVWQEMEFTMFVHFGVNTFTDREWGTGKENPAIFNPTALDTDQWAETAKAAGMKMIILTAKHHDGFCLWPSKFTEHSVKNSPWKDGKGDIVRELATSCKKYGLKVGVYLSPADLYQIESANGYYGNKSTPKKVTIPTIAPTDKKAYPKFEYVLDDYNTYFMNQLYELLTEYGPVHEVWFDGANPKPGTGQKYNYLDWYAIIRQLAPEAVIFGKGPDCRWIGNEAGRSRKAEWSVVPIPIPKDQFDWAIDMTGNDLGSRGKIKDAKYPIWYPAEMDTSIRPGWFYHASQDNRVKSLDQLLDIYYSGTGHNAVLLLNVPPDRRGLFHENDVKRLKELAAVLRETFKTNLTAGATATSDAELDESLPSNTLDGNPDTYWTPGRLHPVAHIQYDLGTPKTFDRAMLQGYIQKGQRIEAFTLEAEIDGQWQEFATGTTIGYKRLLRFPEVTAQKVRLSITQSRMAPIISNFGLYLAPVKLQPPLIRRDLKGRVTLSCKSSGVKIHYTLDGTGPTVESPVFTEPIALPKGGIIKAIAVVRGQVSEVVEMIFDIAPTQWSIHFVDSENPASGEGAEKAIDQDPETLWHSQWQGQQSPHPHEIQINLGETLSLKGFTYLPRNKNLTGTIQDYEFYTSSDGKDWGDPVSKGRFGNIRNNPVEQRILFSSPVKARYIRLVALTDLENKPFTSAAEIGVITR